MRLASRFGYANQIRRDRPLTHEELMHYVPGIFGEDKHTSRSQNYTYISLDLQAGLEARVRENITLGVQAGYAHSVSGSSAEGYNGQATLNVTF